MDRWIDILLFWKVFYVLEGKCGSFIEYILPFYNTPGCRGSKQKN